MFDLNGAWRLHPRVAVRPEPFGALLYHYETRRLTFLKDVTLVVILEALEDATSATDALRFAGVARESWPHYARALDRLASTNMLLPVDATEV